MTTETTTALPIDLPEVTDEMVELATMSYTGVVSYADPCMRTVLTEFRLALLAATPQWQPIERDQIRAGMRIRATVTYLDYVATRTGEAHHTNESGDWCTEFGWLLTGWAAPISYEVDPATIPADPDAELDDKLWRILCEDDECTTACLHCSARVQECKRLVREHDGGESA